MNLKEIVIIIGFALFSTGLTVGTAAIMDHQQKPREHTMADAADRAQQTTDLITNNQINNARADIAPGKPGECDDCGEWTGRLIEGICAPCRDMNELRRKRMIGHRNSGA